MGIIVMFMIAASLTPLLFIDMGKKGFAAVQTVLLIGMWGYFYQALFLTAPLAFSITWVMFYASMITTVASWILFVGVLIKEYEASKTTTSVY